MTEKRCLGDKVFVVDTLKWSQIPNGNHEPQIFTYRGDLCRSHLSDKKGWTVQAAPKSMPRTFNREFSASIEVNLCSRGGKSGSRTLLEALVIRTSPYYQGNLLVEPSTPNPTRIWKWLNIGFRPICMRTGGGMRRRKGQLRKRHTGSGGTSFR